jgi:hypothetical protein
MDDYSMQNGLQRATGSEELDHLQQQELRSEQMRFYQRANSQPVEIGGWLGIRQAAIGVCILLAVGLFFRYIVGVG